MADIPKPRQARPLEAQPVGVLAPYDIAQTGDVGRGLQNLGASLSNIGQDLYQKEADQQFSEYILKRNEATNSMFDVLEGRGTDEAGKRLFLEPDVMPQFYQGVIGAFDKDLPKNAEARRRIKFWEQSRIPQWEDRLKKAIQGRYEEKAAATILSRETALLDETDRNTVVGQLEDIKDQKMYQLGLDEATAEEGRKRSLHLWERTQADNIALSNNPDIFLDKYKTLEDLKKDFPELKASDFRELKQTARSQKAYLEQEKDITKSEEYKKVLSLAASDADPKAVRMKIAQSDGLDIEDKTKLVQAYNAALRLWDNEQTNPWTQTQDHGKLHDTLNKIVKGDIKTYDDINKAFLSGADGTPAFSFQYWLMANNWLEQVQKPQTNDYKYSRTHDIAKSYFDRIDDLMFGTRKVDGEEEQYLPPEKHKDWVSKTDAMERAMMQNWGNWPKIAEEYENITGDIKKKKAKSWLSLFRPHSIFGVPKEFVEMMEGEKREKVPEKAFIPPGLPEPATPEEFDALPSGTVFIYTGEDGEKKTAKKR